MKLDVPDDYFPLLITALEHHYAYTKAVRRESAGASGVEVYPVADMVQWLNAIALFMGRAIRSGQQVQVLARQRIPHLTTLLSHACLHVSPAAEPAVP
jgi:hypothetical protein